jgi:SAM-dependent methyltransferase
MRSLKVRARGAEQMDDPDVSREALQRGLKEIRVLNHILGAYGPVTKFVRQEIASRRSLSVLDIGTGAADHLETIVSLCIRESVAVDAVGVDKHPLTVRIAGSFLDKRLPEAARSSVRVVEGDALDLPFEDDSFDVAIAALVLHHFDDEDCIRLLKEMRRVTRGTLLIFDLQRSLGGLVGIWLLSRLLPFGSMVRADGPLSVRRGFRRTELLDLARQSGAGPAAIRWSLPFKWIMLIRPDSDVK